MHSRPGIAIIGCGWLGSALAAELLKRDYTVVGSTRDQEKAQRMHAAGITPVLFDLADLDQSKQSNTAIAALAQCSQWIVNIPPGRRQLDASAFTRRLRSLIDHAASASIEQLVFVSTTSVYGDAHFTAVTNIVESAAVNPETESAKAHCEIEEYIRQELNERHCILRLAGLVDEQRHPINSLSGRQHIGQPKKPVNLVHKHDVVNAIIKIITLPVNNATLHLSATSHPGRKDYYQWAAQQKGLAVPEFIESQDDATGKQIDPSATLKQLGLTLKYGSPYEML